MPIPKIETHLTRLKADPGYDYSLGILYITRDEAKLIAELIQTMQRAREVAKAFMPVSAMVGASAGPDWVDDLRGGAKRAGMLYPDSLTTDAPGTVRYSKMWTGREWMDVQVVAEVIAEFDRLGFIPTVEQLKRSGIDVDKLEEAEQIAAPSNRFSGLDIE